MAFSLVRGSFLAGAMAIGLAAASPASAVTVSIGLSDPTVLGGAITTVASSPGSAVFVGAYGTWTSNIITGQGNPPLPDPGLANSTASDVSSPIAGSLTIYVTVADISTPTGALEFTTGLTSNLLTAGWTVAESSWLDTANGVFTTVTPLGSALFAAIGTETDIIQANAGAGPYSITLRYIITSNGLGSALSTITVSAVPVPAALPLLATALIGSGLFGWRRRRRGASELRNGSAAA